MNANQAKELTKMARAVDMQAIYCRIEIAAKCGRDSVKINTRGIAADREVDVVVNILESDGYKVMRNRGYDQLDGEWVTASW